jgi:Ca2+-binding EF-hand superfamily protein
MGAGHSQTLPYSECITRIDTEQTGIYGSAFKRMSGHESTIHLAGFLKEFVRPSISKEVATRIFATMVSKSSDHLNNAEVSFEQFLSSIVTFCRADHTARLHFAFALFADGDASHISEAKFTHLFAQTLMLAARMRFKLTNAIALGDEVEMLRNATAEAGKVMRQYAQKKPDALTFDEFAVWAGGNNDTISFLQFLLEKSCNADYALPATSRSLLSAEARVVGTQSEILSADDLTVLGAHLPAAVAPPSSAFVQIYSSAKNGFSVATMVAIHAKLIAAHRLLRDGMLVVIKDSNENLLGFFVR